jgi:stage V sporulation protein AD
MAESLLLGSMLVDGGFAQRVACVASSHFSTAERQYRYPLEMGTTSPPTAQRTVTGAGAVLISDEPASRQQQGPAVFRSIHVEGGTIGKLVDMGISDASNKGAAIAPAACDTIITHLADTGRPASYYDAIITGDLGSFGSEMLHELCMDEGLAIAEKHLDCGNLIFDGQQSVNCGGSGCGCSAVVLSAHLLQLLEKGAWRRILFMATGALMSPPLPCRGKPYPYRACSCT